MRKKVIAGNWKMHNNVQETKDLINIVCPTFTNLLTAANELAGTEIKLGAQNMFYEDKGAFTGEISADMLKSVCAEYVILGHSERRTIFGETDEIINKKILKALEKGLKPIFCIGETLEEREKNLTFNVVKNQIVNGLKNVSADNMKNII
ncbi:MAG: triose-phosphate isomerase, partial [Proteobacteria bacterium]|nr:triose-phosphate isomerase [Pseudomonadota bacterium]